MSEKKDGGGISITNNYYAPIGQHIDHVDTINFSMDGDGTFHFSNVGQVGGAFAARPKKEVFVPSQLRFFDMVTFGSEEKQPKLIALLRETASRIDTTSGRDWFCIYAGYRYCKQQLAVMGGYTDFFADIEALTPDLLTKIDKDEEGDARYHNYTVLMGREASAWYMDKGKLPPLNEITVWKNRFSGDKNRFSNNAPIIIEVYKRLKTI
jgi:hypothetical protein